MDLIETIKIHCSRGVGPGVTSVGRNLNRSQAGEVKMGGGVPYPILFSSCRISGTKIEHYLAALVKRRYIIFCKEMDNQVLVQPGLRMTPMH